MYPSEMIWLSEYVASHGVDVLIECGRQDGVSTRTLGELLGKDTTILSIDFDEDRARLESVKESLRGLNIVCVSGDIHQRVPELLRQYAGRRIAVVQDGPKGWEGLSTLVAAAHSKDVVLIAQHNLHKGHRSRAYFQLLASNPAFLEYDATAVLAQRIRAREQTDDGFVRSNREVDHSSLGICSLKGNLRQAVLENAHELDGVMGPWSALATERAWNAGRFSRVTKLRSRQHFSWYRFKRR
jgi:hypothetical protein